MNSESCLTALYIVIQVEVRGSRFEMKGVFGLRNRARSEIKKGAASVFFFFETGAASVGLRKQCIERKQGCPYSGKWVGP